MTKAFDAFQEYVALKMHLTSDYDYVKFEGRTTLKESSLEKRNDRRFFEKLAHRQKRDVHGFLVAQLSHDPRLWVGNLLGAEAEGRYMSWKRTQESLTYTFRSELNLLKQSHDTFDELIICEPSQDGGPGGQHPALLKHWLAGDISLETTSIIAKLTKFNRHWNHNLSGDPIWEDVKYRVLKYHALFPWDENAMKTYVVQTFMQGSI